MKYSGTLTPAYGRDYKSKKEVLEDFDGGKDFLFNSFDKQCYCSKEDLLNDGIESVQIRFNKSTKVIIVKLV